LTPSSVNGISEYEQEFKADMAIMVADKVFSIAGQGLDIKTIAEEICLTLQRLIKYPYI
jgi:hypothetical protein